MQLSERGVRVAIYTESKEVVEGWLWAETSDGILVSLDEEGRDMYVVRTFRTVGLAI